MKWTEQCNRSEPLLFWSVWHECTHMYKSLVFDDEFLAHLKSHQRCSAAFCRPVKFFHTDWIIISLWFLSYTQRHCHVRIEKSPVQTVSIKLEELDSKSFTSHPVFCTSYCFALFYFIAHFTLISPFLTICMPLCYVTYTICILIVLHCPLSGPDSIAFHF